MFLGLFFWCVMYEHSFDAARNKNIQFSTEIK
jgi:hypothetical protein